LKKGMKKNNLAFSIIPAAGQIIENRNAKNMSMSVMSVATMNPLARSQY